MLDNRVLLGLAVTHVIYVFCILVFIARLIKKCHWDTWLGIPILFMALPLLYLLWKPAESPHPFMYKVQIFLALCLILWLLVFDYLFQIDFRQSFWMVVVFTILFFAGTGGLLGVASLAGKSWTISATGLYLMMAVLAFVQRNQTGY
ncbi:hypothetical protein GF406_27215 [candidate division KSB1 bacterium]|nr:hypothetical protein [candidate division KSB1 bacterium]